MNYQKLIYLASPYTHPDPAVVRQRVAQVQIATANAIFQGNLVFSPIVHSDPIKDLVHFDPHNTSGEMSEWMEYDKAFIENCDELWVLMLDGWQESKGVITEIAHAIANGIPRRYVTYPTLIEHPPGQAYKKHPTPTVQGDRNSEVDDVFGPAPVLNCLQIADSLVSGDRQQDYGHPIEDFTRTALIWEAILGIEVTPEQVALCMVGVKISREVNQHKADNIIDGCGYLRTLEMVYEYKAAN